MSVVIESVFKGITQALDFPRICFDAHTATATATGTASGSDVNWITDGETWTVWQGDAVSQTVTLTFAGATKTAYAGIAAHNLGTSGATVELRLDGVSIVTATPDDDSALLFLFKPRDVTTVEFVISGGSVAPQMAVAQAGMPLEMPRLSDFLGLPISESKQVTYRHQTSITGDVLGRAVEGASMSFELPVQYLPETFRTDAGTVSWKAFIDHVDNVGPFFVASKPSKYPDDVAYARVTERPRFNRELPNKAASGSVVFKCMGYVAP